MRTLQAYSTFPPLPFVSMSRGTVYALPQHVMHPSHHNPHPAPHSRSTYRVPSSLISLTSLISNDSVVLSAASFSQGHGVAGTRVHWNVTDVNQTTPLSVTSSLTSERPYFPAGYPSGYTWPHIVCASVIVTVVILMIVVGNFLVMWAIVRDKNLKGTQNYFIGSLALADFLLGLVIVPFSLANELMGYWHFGTVLCEVWKALDVLLCTASITSLCLISLDRYWSITKAIHYSRQRTPRRAAVMIFIVWFISAAICIPPLIGWNQPAPDSDWPTCTLSEDIGYVMYSSMGSFYIPAFIMVFVYFKIYQAAKARARKGVTKVPRAPQSEKSEQRNSTESSGNEHQHRQPETRLQSEGSASTTVTQQQTVTEQKSKSLEKEPFSQDTDGRALSSLCQCSNEMTEDDSLTPHIPQDTQPMRQELDFRRQGSDFRRQGSDFRHQGLDFRSRSVSLPSRTRVSNELTRLLTSTDSDSCETLSGPVLNQVERSRSCVNYLPATATTTTTTDTDSSADVIYAQDWKQQTPPSYHAENARDFVPREGNSPVTSPVGVTMRECVVTQHDNGTVHHFTILEPTHNGSTRKATEVGRGVFGSLKRQWLQQNNGKLGEKRKCLAVKKKGAKKMGRGEDFSSAERHKRKLAKARERRATLVLGLVMAAFILCWLPFFLLYVVSAFCEGCIPMMVFTVFFWIGYCNSALNPIIYTVFNRDFRRAFHRILCGRRQGWW